MKRTFISKSCRKAILASRMIRSAEQAAAISAAIDDPINTELVQQLDSYLGDEYRELLIQVRNEKAHKDDQKPEEPDKQPDESMDSGMESGMGASPKFGGGGGSVPSRFSDRPSAIVDEETPDLPGDFVGEEETSEVESTSKVYGKPISASSCIESCNIDEAVSGIKGFLNSNSSTAGAERLAVKDDEVWIYFNDSINLNNVMVSVIEYMTNPYPWLAFNRLARSENAIVFAVNYIDQFDRNDVSDSE